MKCVKTPGTLAVCLLAITACGGGSSTSTAVDGSEGGAQSGPVHGFLTIEERAGKRIFDAWFAHGTFPATVSQEIWASGEERCRLEDAAWRESSTVIDWRKTLYAGESIEILSRSGSVVSLLPQEYANAVVYAAAERWSSEPLPEDAQLLISGDGQVPAFGPVDLVPLTPLVRLQPSGGVSLDAAQPIVWETSQAPDDAIELTVSVMNLDNSDHNQSVHCSLADSGVFALPTALIQVLSDDSPLVYTLVRTRTASHESEGAYLHIAQFSIP